MRTNRHPPASSAAATRLAIALACLLLPVAAPGNARAVGEPVDVFFVLDNSGSMRTNDPDRKMRALVVEFATSMSPGSRLGVVVFDESARVVAPLDAQVGPGSGLRWNDVMSSVDYAGRWTNSPAGIERALYEFKQSGRDGVAKCIVFVTDGLVDTGDRVRDVEKTRWLREELAADARRDGVAIYGIALAELADVELIQALAHRTGGDYWRAPDADRIATALASAGRRMRESIGRTAPVAPSATPAAMTPPVSAAPRDATRGPVLLGLGVAIAALVLVAPFVRRRLRMHVRPSHVASLASEAHSPLLPALPRDGRAPIVELVDVSDATGRGRPVLLLDAPTTRIGRDPGNHVVIPSDTVSSFHATIDYRDGYFHVEDQRSTNGTSVGGRRLFANRPKRLKSGDVIDVAGYPFRFLIPDHEPRGRTRVLDVSAGPGGRGVASPVPQGEVGASSSVDRLVSAFDACLGGHLARIAALGDDHRRFVERAFPIEIRALLVRRGQDLIERCLREGQGGQAELAKERIHYVICALPSPLDRARDWYVERHGGFAKFLVGLLDARTGSPRACDAICVITFGMQSESWLSITIVPARSDGDAVEVMSLEFLTEDERREAASLDIVDADDPARPA